MNEKAPEEAERGSALRISSPEKKVARKLGAERMWPSGGGARTGNHKGWKVTAVAGDGSSTNRSAIVRNVRRPGKNWVQGKCDDAC